MKTNLLFSFVLALASSTMFAQDPVVLNSDFDKIPKISGSDCSCSGWMNKSLGDQAESSEDIDETPGNDAIKFDNFEADLMYQEIAVLANTDYKLTYRYRVSGGEDGTSELEIRVLKGTGYTDGYVPTYYATPVEVPSDGFGYSDITVVENVANNIATIVEAYPGNDDYTLAEFTFNTGDETSIAILARGIGRPNTPNDDNDCDDAPEDITRCYTWSAGDQETRIDYVALTNESLSVGEFSAQGVKVYPNPAKDYINIDSNTLEVASVAVYDILGKNVLSQKGLNNNRLDVSMLNNGVYFLQINANGNTTIKKIIIE